MTRGQTRKSSRSDAARAIHAPRIRMKPTAHGNGHVNGARGQHRDDQMTDPPALIATPSMRPGAIIGALYQHAEGRVTPAEPLSDQLPTTIEVLDTNGNNVAVRVIPASSVDTLHMISAKDRESRAKQEPSAGLPVALAAMAVAP